MDEFVWWMMVGIIGLIVATEIALKVIDENYDKIFKAKEKRSHEQSNTDGKANKRS